MTLPDWYSWAFRRSSLTLILDDIFGQRQVVHAEDSRERGDHAPGLAPEEMLVQIHRKTTGSISRFPSLGESPPIRRPRLSGNLSRAPPLPTGPASR